MKSIKFASTLALIFLPMSANAEMSTTTSGGDSKRAACAAAKEHALLKASNNQKEVVSFSACNCDGQEGRAWDCTVDATMQKKK